MFNLESLALTSTVTLQIRHPVSDDFLFADEAKKQPISIELHGTSSKEYRNAITAMQNRALKRGKKQASAEIMKEEGVELLVLCSVKISHLSYDGKPVNDDASFRAIYSDAKYSWLKDQVDALLGDNSNFLQA